MMAAQGTMADQTAELPLRIRAARFGLALLTALISVNLWTGAPLFAIWVGSRVQGRSGTGLTMGAVVTVLAVLAASVALLVFLLIRVEAAYKFLSGEPVQQKRVSPWMRSLRDERPDLVVKRPATGFEKALVATVVAAILVFEAWFFFFAGSSIG